MQKHRPDRTPSVLGVLAGIVLLAALVGGLLLLQWASGGDEEPISLPAEVDGLTALDARDDATAAQAEAAFDYNDEKVSEALDGAAADSRIYAAEDGSKAIRVVAYRAEAGPLLPPMFQDPAVSRTGVVQEVETHGQATCLVTRASGSGDRAQPPGAGQPEPGELVGAKCQRTSPGLTVTLEMQGLEVSEGVELLGEIYTGIA